MPLFRNKTVMLNIIVQYLRKNVNITVKIVHSGMPFICVPSTLANTIGLFGTGGKLDFSWKSMASFKASSGVGNLTCLWTKFLRSIVLSWNALKTRSILLQMEPWLQEWDLLSCLTNEFPVWYQRYINNISSGTRLFPFTDDPTGKNSLISSSSCKELGKK